MTTKLQLFNLALSRVGHTELLTDDTDVVSQAGILCNQLYNFVCRKALRDYPWRFAKVRDVLVASKIITPPDEWGYAYDLPANCARIIGVYPAGIKNTILDSKIPFERMIAYAYPDDIDIIFSDLEEAEVVYTTCVEDSEPTLLQVYNLALIRIGYTELLTSETDITSVAGLPMNAVYEMTRDAILNDFPWRFAKKRLALFAYDTTEPDEWAYVYELPDDCLKPRYLVTPGNRTPLVDDRIPFEVKFWESKDKFWESGDMLFTDLEDAELVYTVTVVDGS